MQTTESGLPYKIGSLDDPNVREFLRILGEISREHYLRQQQNAGTPTSAAPTPITPEPQRKQRRRRPGRRATRRPQ